MLARSVRCASSASPASGQLSRAFSPTFRPSTVFSLRPFSSSPTFPSVWKVDDPYTGSIYCEIPTITESESLRIISASSTAQRSWRNSTLETRIQLVRAFIERLEQQKSKFARDITGQMGKPLKQSIGEVNTIIARANALVELSRTELVDEFLAVPPGFMKKISKEPVGVVLALCPWNYPANCAVNSVVAAVLSGCSVLIKHSDRTPLVANHFAEAFAAAGAPAGLVQTFHANHPLVAQSIAHPSIAHVAFTGSVAGGRAVYQAVAKSRFIDCGLELGGKDPAYVTEDCDLAYAASNVVDGACYNAGQSCCAVERVYVHEKVHDEFVRLCVAEMANYKLGNPMDAITSMGPLAQPNAPKFLESQVKQAVELGAKVLIGGSPLADSAGKGRFFQPTVLTHCSHKMSIMMNESFGPVLPIQKVRSDSEALDLMNDSPFGLTASVWTNDAVRAEKIAREIDTGTVYQNRCDVLDPFLPWSGRKDSGKGFGLSHYGFIPFYRTKGYNFKVAK